ncbi:hypothetical protein [Paraburkholderia aromaticivorans]|uniref:hypothetical protein n=1 Tax=Paraburkholderia aromaticivorans TaxID=2026199 RepID=UPI00145605B7|nr:hypothetical protein [Paraburkholderia aromaticivorans]
MPLLASRHIDRQRNQILANSPDSGEGMPTKAPRQIRVAEKPAASSISRHSADQSAARSIVACTLHKLAHFQMLRIRIRDFDRMILYAEFLQFPQ